MTSEPSGQFINPMALGVTPNLLQGTFPLSHTASAASARNPPLSVLSNVLKLSNVPSDLTPREAALIFALVSDDLVSVDVKDYSIIASFKNPSTCLTTGKLLDGRYIFGAKYAPVKAELEPPAPASNSSSNHNNSISGFENLSLSNGISPPPSHSHSLQQPPQASSDLQSQQQPFDAYQKRASVGNQRSRFLFSDPFSGATTPTNTASGSIDLSDLTGKSLLLMKSHADGRDYESMPRDPWNSQNSTNLAFASNPQTPGIANVNPYDWSAATPSQASAPMQPQPNPMPTSQKSPVDSSGERRRTSSFFNGSAQISQTPSHQVQASNSSLQNANSSLQNPNSSLQPSTSQLQNQSSSSNAQQQQQNPTNQHSQSNEKAPAQTVAAIISQGPSQQSNAALPPLSTSQPGARSGPSSAAGAHSATTTPTSSGRGSSKDVLDLSLLARVPPPANPADQNPPCNTLYVGNLPPDATEAELRSLFAPQKGFRRLSFRTKNQPSNGGSNGGANGSNGSNSSGSNGNSNSSSHNHGPMCFVEFEDVAHATIALAELYGRALPRPAGSNSKGGIRLSFSKNPLGVRGPGNPRRTSNSQQPSSSGSSGVGNYGYSNYHNQ